MKRSFIKPLCVCLFLAFMATNSYAQVSGYAFAQSSGTYSAITGTNLSATNWDDNNYTLAIPFSIAVNGTSYSSCNVNSNGYITLGATLPGTTVTNPISNSTAYSAAISAFGRDLTNNSSAITYGTINSAPNRIFIIQWNSARRKNGGSAVTGDVLNFQIRLYETAGIIEVRYGTCSASSTTALTNETGLRGTSNSDYNNRTTTTNWSATTAGASNSASCTSKNTIMPVSGLTFTWTPPSITINSVHPAAANLNQSSSSNPIAAYQLVNGGISVTPSSFQFATSGTYTAATDITKFTLWQNSTNTLSGATSIANITASGNPQTLTFTGFPSSIAASATTYFIITADVPSSAGDGKTVSIAANSLSNFDFTSVAVIVTGTATAGNTQTITGPDVTVAAAHPSPGLLNQNSTSNPIASYQIVTGTKSVTPSNFTFVTAGTYTASTDITKFSLWQNSTNSASGATLIGNITASGSSQTLSFSSGFAAIPSSTTTYFIITADLPLTATDGKTVSIAANSFTNFTYTVSAHELGTNPVPASNVQTIAGPDVTITQAHPAAGSLSQSTANNPIAAYQIATGTNAVTPSSFTFLTAGTYAAISDVTKFSLYQNSINSVSGATLIGNITSTVSGQTLVFNSGFTSIPASTTTYFIVTADIPLSATDGNTINITPSNFSNFLFTVSAHKMGPNPVPPGNTQTIAGPDVTVTQAHPVAGTLNQSSTINPIASYQLATGTKPVTPSNFTFVTAGTYTAVADITKFSLYQNSTNSITGATLIGNITASGNPQTLIFNTGFSVIPASTTAYFIITADVPLTAINGRTVNIVANNFSNFTYTVSAHELGTNPVPAGNTQTIYGPSITINQAHPAAGNINQNSTDNPIAAYKMDITNGNITPSSFTFVTAGTYQNSTDISNFRLFQNTSNSLTGATLIGTIAGGTRPQTLTFNSGFTNITSGSTVYFIITVDLPLTALYGGTINISSTNFSNFIFSGPGGSAVEISGTNPVAAGNVQTILSPVVNITAIHPSAGTIDQGTQNNIIATYKLDASYGTVIPKGLTINTSGTYTSGTDITKFSLYQNNANNSISPTFIASVTATGAVPQTLVFTGTGDPISAGTSQYLFVVADVPLSGTDQKTVGVASTSLSNFSFTGSGGSSVTKTGSDPAAASPFKTISGPRITIQQVHPAAANITRGTTDNPIATYQLNVTNLSTGFINTQSVNFTTGGTYAAGDITSFSLWQNSANTLSGATLVGSVTGTAAGQNISFNSGFVQIANAGYSYLMITANVGISATLNKTVLINSNSFTNFNFLSSWGSSVNKLGTNPASASNTQTIVTPTVDISAAHPLAGNMLNGSTDNLLAAVKVITSYGDITPTLASFTTSAGSYVGSSDVIKFGLYQNDANSLTGATLVGTINATASSSQVLTFTSGFTAMPAGTTNYLLLCADLKGSSTPARTISILAVPLSNLSFTSSGPVLVNGTFPLAASNNQTIVAKLDVYSTGAKNWDNSTANWGGNAGGSPGGYANYVWLTNGIAQLEGTAGQLNVTAPVIADQIKSMVTNYKIDASSTSNGITLTTPATINVTSGTTYVGNTSSNPVLYGMNGLTKIGTGELQIGSDLGSTFSGTIFGNAGEITLGKKAGGYNGLTTLNYNRIELNNSRLTIATSASSNSSPTLVQQLSSIALTGNDTIGLYQTNSSTNYMNLTLVTNTSSLGSSNGVPLTISGRLTIDNSASPYTNKIWGNAQNQNFIAFGNTTYTGNTTFEAYAKNADLHKKTGDMINLNLGGYGHYITGVAVASGTIDDNGYTSTFLGGGGTNSDGAQISFNAAASSMTGDWIIGDAAGTNAAWVVTNTSTCLTRGSVTINNYSKLNLQLSTPGNSTITYSPSVINVYGLGPYSKTNSYTYGSALDFYDFARASDTITLPCNVVLFPVSNSKLASIGVMVGTDSTSNASGILAAFQLNGTLTGTAGLQKDGPGILILNAQNGSGYYNTYADTTRIRRGTISVNTGSNLGTGPVVMYQIAKNNTVLNFYNTAQTIGSLTSLWTDNSGQSQKININGTTLTINQNTSTTFGNGTGTSVGYISGTGNIIKDGTGTLTLTGANTYTGLTQIKGGVLELKNSLNTTLPSTNNIDIIGGTLQLSVNQTLNNVTLSTGYISLAANVTLTINGTLNLATQAANITLGANAKIVYGTNGSLIYCGNTMQQTSIDSKELPNTNGPKNIAFSNFSTNGVQLSSNISLTGGAAVYGWLDLNGKIISGTGGAFVLNGLTENLLNATTVSGSATVTNVNTNKIDLGMLVSGPGIPSNTTVIYINPLAPQTVTLSNNATISGTNTLSFGYRGGLVVSLPGGIDAHIKVTASKNYKSGASYIFKTPTSGSTIYPAFPTVGTLNYSPAYDVTITAGTGNKVIMNSVAGSANLTVSNNLSLTSGIWITNDNLVTWDNSGGTLTAPNIPYTSSNSIFSNSYVCTCDASGTPISPTGSNGFRINNVSGNAEIYFPVGADLTSANRMSLNMNNSTTSAFTVVVSKGDLLGTPKPRVNRIWYVTSSAGSGVKASMKLFFTKRDWYTSQFSSAQDEVETGYLYDDNHLVQKDYTGLFVNNSKWPDDIVSFIGIAYNTEIYGQYSINISSDVYGNKNGINTFSRFSIVNSNNIILPVSIINFKASQQAPGVKLEWTCLNERNIDHYEIQKSNNGIDFATIAVVNAKDNQLPAINYAGVDAKPQPGNNFYRIKTVGKDNNISYTEILSIKIGETISSLRFFPNPVTGNALNIQWSNGLAGRYNLSLYNASGQKVLDRVIMHPGGYATQQVLLPPALPKGNYLLKLFSESTYITTKITVQ